MTQYFTLGDVLTEIDEELDLTSQDGVADSLCTRSEKVGYVNRAIAVIESEIHKLGREDVYFRAAQPLQLAEGEQAYSLPTNIYGNKILQIVYHNGDIIYEIQRLRRLGGRSIYEQAAYIEQYGQANYYQYMIRNDGAAFRPEIWLYPASRETAPSDPDSQQIATIYYIRQANVVTQDDDIIDVPEGITYIKQFLKCRILSKQNMGSVPEDERNLLESYRADLVSVLREMVPDTNNLIDQDIGFYTDFDSDVFGSYGAGGY